MALGEAPASQQRVQRSSGETVSGEIGDGDGLLCVWDAAAHSIVPAGSSAEVPPHPSPREGQEPGGMSQPVKPQALNRAGGFHLDGGFHHAVLFMWALTPLQAAPQGVICPFRGFPGFGVRRGLL